MALHCSGGQDCWNLTWDQLLYAANRGINSAVSRSTKFPPNMVRQRVERTKTICHCLTNKTLICSSSRKLTRIIPQHCLLWGMTFSHQQKHSMKSALQSLYLNKVETKSWRLPIKTMLTTQTRWWSCRWIWQKRRKSRFVMNQLMSDTFSTRPKSSLGNHKCRD